MFRKLNKSENFKPGFICVLHTFGRNLKWNPHIHVLLSEGGAGNKTVWRKINYFNYTLLRNSFRTALLNLMEERIGFSFKKVKGFIYKHCPNGFYIYAKPSLISNKEIIKYIGRYLGRPIIATSRIDNYDGTSVTFHYKRHEDGKLVSETIPATEFIKKLIVHIPDKHFKTVRYYGIYAKKHKHFDKLFLALSQQKRHSLKSLNNWRMSLLSSFGNDPILCNCGNFMVFLKIHHNSAPLIEIYKEFCDTS
jgi:hypothetical protein